MKPGRGAVQSPGGRGGRTSGKGLKESTFLLGKAPEVEGQPAGQKTGSRREGKKGGPRAAARLSPDKRRAGGERPWFPLGGGRGAHPEVLAPAPAPLRALGPSSAVLTTSGGRPEEDNEPRFPAETARPGQAPPSGAARPSGPAGAMGAGGLWVRTAHTALSGGLALGLFLHRTGEAEPPLPSPHTRPRRGREREGGRGGCCPPRGRGRPRAGPAPEEKRRRPRLGPRRPRCAPGERRGVRRPGSGSGPCGGP